MAVSYVIFLNQFADFAIFTQTKNKLPPVGNWLWLAKQCIKANLKMSSKLKKLLKSKRYSVSKKNWLDATKYVAKP